MTEGYKFKPRDYTNQQKIYTKHTQNYIQTHIITHNPTDRHRQTYIQTKKHPTIHKTTQIHKYKITNINFCPILY